jgi:predicted nuclease of predicted toxin-antitoxin system
MIRRPHMFLLDENMPRKILTALRVAGYHATRVYEAGLRSQPDRVIFAAARAQHLTISTFDTHYLNQLAFPPPHAGIIVLRFFPRDTPILELISAVLKAVAQIANFLLF